MNRGFHCTTLVLSHERDKLHARTCTCIYHSVPGKAHGRLNVTCDFGPGLGSISIRLYKSCYSGPLKCSTWALARDTMVHT